MDIFWEIGERFSMFMTSPLSRCLANSSPNRLIDTVILNSQISARIGLSYSWHFLLGFMTYILKSLWDLDVLPGSVIILFTLYVNSLLTGWHRHDWLSQQSENDLFLYVFRHIHLTVTRTLMQLVLPYLNVVSIIRCGATSIPIQCWSYIHRCLVPLVMKS